MFTANIGGSLMPKAPLEAVESGDVERIPVIIAGKVVMECVIETKAKMILQFVYGLRGDVHVTFEEGTGAAWFYMTC